MTIPAKVTTNPGTGGSSVPGAVDGNGATWLYTQSAFLTGGQPNASPANANVQGVDAGHGLPVDNGSQGISLAQLAREGRFQYKMGGTPVGFSTNTHPTVTPNASVVTSSNIGAIPLGRAFVVVSAEVSADGLCLASFSDAGSLMTLASGQLANYTGDAYSVSGIIPTNGGTCQFRWQGGNIFTEYHQLQASIINNTSTGVFFSGHAEIIDITNDLHFGARYRVMCFGDSTSWTMPGTNGVTANTNNPRASGRDLDKMRIVERLRAKGASVRLINKSFGSSQSSSMLMRFLCDAWADNFADLYIIDLGMNDAANGGLASSLFQTNIGTLITRLQYINPNCSIVVCAPNSTNDPDRTYINIVAASSVGTAATSSTVTLPSSAGVSAGNLVWVIASGSNSGQYATLGTNISGNQWNIVGGWPLGTPTGTLTISVYNQTPSATAYIGAIRTAAQAAATAGSTTTSDVVYADKSTAFTNSNANLALYCGDTAPSVHPNQAGHGLTANVLATAIQGTNFYTKVLGLSGTF